MGDTGSVGGEIAGFRILEVIGRGGMGVVYLAQQVSPRRRVALKVLSPQLSHDPRFQERFARESEAAASTEHPNIVPIYASGEAEGSLYLAMRYVEGTDLRRLIDREAPLDPERAVAIVSQVAAALDAAHRRGLVHRDVKPGNVLLDEVDNAYLSDFGLIRQSEVQTELTETGQFMGSIEYCAPEQIRGEPVDGRADVYSLGCVLHECLSGRSPFKRATEVATLYAHLEEPPPGLDGSDAARALEPVVARAVAKRATDRFATAGELAREARHVLGQSSGERVAAPRRRRVTRPKLVVGSVLVAFGLIVTAAVLVAGGDEDAGPGGRSTARLSARVVRVDPASGSVVETIEDVQLRLTTALVVGGFAAGEGGLWVGNPPTLSHVDPATGERAAILNLGSPHAVPLVAFRTVWVVTTTAIERVNPATDQLLRPVELPASAGIVVPGAVEAGEGSLWLARGGTLYRIDPVEARVTDEVAIEGSSGLAVGEGSLWVIDSFAGTLTALDPTKLEPTGSIALPGDLDAVVAGGGRVWVLDAHAGTIAVLDPDTLEVLGTIRVGEDVRDMVFGAGALWLADGAADSISTIDPLTEQVTSFPLGTPAREVAVDAGTGAVWALLEPTPVK